jgi:hypothetical protein
MKIFFAVLLVLPLFSVSQNCELKDEKDRYNQDPRLTTGFKEFAKGPEEFLFSVSADKTEVDLFFSLSKSNGICFDDYSRATVVFEGGKQRASFRNGGTTNCKGNFHFIFKNQESLPANLTNLTLKKIQSIQLIGNDQKKVELTPTVEEQELIKEMLTCVVNELENLRKDTWKPKNH